MTLSSVTLSSVTLFLSRVADVTVPRCRIVLQGSIADILPYTPLKLLAYVLNQHYHPAQDRFGEFGEFGRARRRSDMVTVALLVRLEAKPGKEADVENFLKGGLPIVQEEPATTAWFAIRMGPSTFGIFDAFPDDAGRQAHLSGRVAAALMAQAADLFTQPPSIEQVDVLAAKLPGD
jgi:quinol monooxygenase YgiN